MPFYWANKGTESFPRFELNPGKISVRYHVNASLVYAKMLSWEVQTWCVTWSLGQLVISLGLRLQSGNSNGLPRARDGVNVIDAIKRNRKVIDSNVEANVIVTDWKVIDFVNYFFFYFLLHLRNLFGSD